MSTMRGDAFGQWRVVEEPPREEAPQRLEGLGSADVALIRRLESLRPGELLPQEPVDPGLFEEQDAEWLIVDSAATRPVNPESQRLRWAAVVAEGIEQELEWYFKRRDKRYLSWRKNPVSQPCARTVFAREMRRYANGPLRQTADREELTSWCAYLRRLIAMKPFTAANLMWNSRFERTLEACLVRLEDLRLKLEGEEPQLPRCRSSREEIAQGLERQGPPLDRCEEDTPPSRVRVASRGAAAAMQRACRASGDVVLKRAADAVGAPGAAPLCKAMVHARFMKTPLMAPLAKAVLKPRWPGSCTYGLACAELASHLLDEGRAYHAGHIDGRMFLEETVATVTSTAGLAVRGVSSPLLLAGGLPICAVLFEAVGASAATMLLGFLFRRVIGTFSDNQLTRALQRAYATLGLSPSGVTTYSPEDIERQMSWRLRTGSGEASRLWIAYCYIREYQHPALRDPWQPQVHRGAAAASSPLPWPSISEATAAAAAVAAAAEPPSLPSICEACDGASAACSQEFLSAASDMCSCLSAAEAANAARLEEFDEDELPAILDATIAAALGVDRFEWKQEIEEDEAPSCSAKLEEGASSPSSSQGSDAAHVQSSPESADEHRSRRAATGGPWEPSSPCSYFSLPEQDADTEAPSETPSELEPFPHPTDAAELANASGLEQQCDGWNEFFQPTMASAFSGPAEEDLCMGPSVLVNTPTPPP